MKLIAGIDPGKTAAVALVDISSDFVKVFSRRDFSISDICNYLIEHGGPIIIATDKGNPPAAIKKIASSFNARFFSPEKDLGISEKKDITKNFTFDNDHEQDALAAALYAKKEFSGLFEKIDYTLEKKNLLHMSDSVKELLVKNEVGNIEQAIKLLTPEKQENNVKVVPRVIETKKVMELNEKIEQRDKTIEFLRKQIRELRNENAELRRTPNTPEDSKIENLRKSIATLRQEKDDILKQREKSGIIQELKEKYEIIYKPEDFSDPNDMKNKVIIVDNNFSVAKFQPKAIISAKIPKHEVNVPVIQPEKVNIRKVSNIPVADKKEIEHAIKQSFLEWLDKYKGRFHEQI